MIGISYSNAPPNTKRVYYEGSDTLRTGYALCYNYDYGTASEADFDRWVRVEKPATANLGYFAGVVHPSNDGFVGPGWINIITKSSICRGWTDLSCTLGSTSLTIVDGSYALHNGGTAVGTAMQTVDRSGTAGTVLTRLTAGG